MTFVVDAGVLIAAYDSDDAHHEWVMATLKELRPEQLMVNVVTLAESLVHPVIGGRGEAILSAVNALGLQIVSLTDDDALPLAKVRASSGLRMPDAIVLHTALARGVDVLTTDHALARSALANGRGARTPRE